MNELIHANRAADTKFAIWRAHARMNELGYSTQAKVDQAYDQYIRAEANRQLVRMKFGLCYLLTDKMKSMLDNIEQK